METNVLLLVQLTTIREANQSASKAVQESYEAALVCASDAIH